MALIYAKRPKAKRRAGKPGAPLASAASLPRRRDGQADRQVFMAALYSSPFFPLLSPLHFFILSCCVIGAAGAAIALSPDRQVFMNALRSSPFLSPAALLQSPIFDCCFVIAPLAAMPGASLC